MLKLTATVPYLLTVNYNFILQKLVFTNIFFSNRKNILTIIIFCIRISLYFLMKAVKTMSDIARNQDLAIITLPLLLGLALLRLLFKATCPSSLGHH